MTEIVLTSPLLPNLVISDADAELKWLTAALGAIESNGQPNADNTVMHVEIKG